MLILRTYTLFELRDILYAHGNTRPPLALTLFQDYAAVISLTPLLRRQGHYDVVHYFFRLITIFSDIIVQIIADAI